MPKHSTTQRPTQTANTTAYISVGRDEYLMASRADRLVARDIRSDIALLIQASKASFAALLRFSFPNSIQNAEIARQNPFNCADTGIRLLIDSIRSFGVDYGDLSACAIGGATSVFEDNSAQIGTQNQLATRQILEREGIRLQGEDLGGHHRRSLWFDAASGRLIVRSAQPLTANLQAGDQQEKELLFNHGIRPIRHAGL